MLLALLLQLMVGRLEFPQIGLLYAAYVLWAALLLILGRHLADAVGLARLAGVVAGAFAVGALANAAIALAQWLGIAGGTLSSAIAEEIGLDSATRGVLVSEVTAGGPAEAAGLRGGDPTTGLGSDVITAVDGQPVLLFDDLLGYIVQQSIGQSISLTILRDGQPQTLTVTLGERPATIEQPQLQQDGFELPNAFPTPTP